MKGTETFSVHRAWHQLRQSHGGVPLVKGTETCNTCQLDFTVRATEVSPS